MASLLRRLLGLSSPHPKSAGDRAPRYLKQCAWQHRFKADDFFSMLVEDALYWRATDIHVVPEKNVVRIRLRVDGVLRNFLMLEPQQGKTLIGRLKVVGGMDILNYFAPQDGAGQLEVNGQEIPFRISTIPVQGDGVVRERAILRLFNQRNFDLSALGLESGILARWQRLLDEPQGMLVLTGPANSGKTTTIYSSLLDIQNRSRDGRNIATVEDPVEFPVPGLSQSQINVADGFGFPEALRAMMRQDPQVIMVGEIHDPDTARIGIEASLTGHLVLATIHSKQVTGVFPRLQSLGVENVAAASAVLAVLNQRLIRLNCQDCLRPYESGADYLHRLPAKMRDIPRFQRGGGCNACGKTGLFGRSTVCELLVIESQIRTAICSGVTAQELYDRAVSLGMATLWDSALRHVLAGAAPLEETIQIVGTA